MVLSAQSSRTLEEVAQAATCPLWFQSYFFKDRDLTLAMAHRAEAAGYGALCLTLDAKVKPKRERNIRNNYVGPASPNYAHLNITGSTWSFGLDGPTGADDLRDPAFTWADLDWLAANTRLPLVSRASWWGRMTGRPPITAPAIWTLRCATIEALPEVVEAVAGQAEVYLDGGIRRGTDVFKALALGARAVLIGPADILGPGSGR